MELIDREVELRRREVKPANLEGLRKRISTLFLQFIKTPTFNPAVGRLLKVRDPVAELIGRDQILQVTVTSSFLYR